MMTQTTAESDDVQPALDLRQGEYHDRRIHRGHQHAGHDDRHREPDPLRRLARAGGWVTRGADTLASLTFDGTLLAVARTTLEDGTSG